MENALLEGLLRACLHGGVLAAVVWLTARVARRLPLSLMRWAWWLVCAKALLAFTGWAWISLPVLPVVRQPLQSTDAPVATVYNPPPVKADSPRPAPPVSVLGSAPTRSTTVPQLDTPTILVWLWAGGVAVLFVGMGRRWARLERLWRGAKPLAHPDWKAALHRLCVQMELPFVPEVRLSAGDHPPLALVGKRVLVPARLWEQLSDEQRRMTLAHELSHLQRGDAWWGLVPMLAQSLLFFFPPIWYAARQWELGCEVVSDAAAVRTVGCAPYAYGELLLRVAERMRPTPVLLGIGATHNFAHLRTRLQQLEPMPYRARRLGVATLGLAALLALPWQLTAQTSSQDLQEWHQKLTALRRADWREAFETGLDLASLPPETGYALLAQHWNSLPVRARQQMLKAFYFTLPYPLRPRVHPKLLHVMELGVNDRSPKVRSWAESYLQDLALREFEDTDALKAWLRKHKDLPLEQVVRMHWEPFLRELTSLPEAQRAAHWQRLDRSFPWLREQTVVRPLAFQYRLPELLTQMLHARRTNPEQEPSLTSILGWLHELAISEQEWRRILAPFLDLNQPCVVSARAQVIEHLATFDYDWAIPNLLALAREALRRPEEPTLWGALVDAFARFGEPDALPLLREMLQRTTNPDLRKRIKDALHELEG